jgi:hypothetical protein
MIINLDNSQRVFLIKRDGFFTRTYFCNLEHIPTILSTELEKYDSFTISEFWNFKFKKCSKKFLNEMFLKNQINCKI